VLAPPKAVPTGPPSDNTSATRHLSAGAYIDPEFCLDALHQIYHQPSRMVAPSYGFDLVTVLGHCLRARYAMVVRDALIVSLLLSAALISWLAVVVILVILLCLHGAVVFGQVVQDLLRYLRDEQRLRDELLFQQDGHIADPRPASSGLWRRRRRSRGTAGQWLLGLVLHAFGRAADVALAYLTFLGLLTGLGLALLAASLALRADIGIVWFGGPWETVAALLLATLLVPAGYRVWNQLQLRNLSPEQVPVPPLTSQRLTEIDRQLRGNTVVYSGFQPFVGSGDIIRRWDFAQRLVRAEPNAPERPGSSEPEDTSTTATRHEAGWEQRREFDKPPFTAQALSEHVRKDLAALADALEPEQRLPGLKVEDKIFVAGTAISTLAPDTPEKEIKEIISSPTAPQRHYLVCQVVSWKGELVTTVYVHIAVQGKALYVELQVTALLPCDERFRVIDQVSGTSTTKLVRDAMRAVLESPVVVASAPASLFRACADALEMAFATPVASIKVKQGYDYGATVGLRELAASAVPEDHMQMQDIFKYSRVIERRVLAAILDFLEDNDVDVNEYRQRSLTILNAGAVAVGGGTVNVEGNAIGTQSNQTAGGDA